MEPLLCPRGDSRLSCEDYPESRAVCCGVDTAQFLMHEWSKNSLCTSGREFLAYLCFPGPRLLPDEHITPWHFRSVILHAHNKTETSETNKAITDGNLLARWDSKKRQGTECRCNVDTGYLRWCLELWIHVCIEQRCNNWVLFSSNPIPAPEFRYLLIQELIILKYYYQSNIVS